MKVRPYFWYMLLVIVTTAISCACAQDNCEVTYIVQVQYGNDRIDTLELKAKTYSPDGTPPPLVLAASENGGTEYYVHTARKENLIKYSPKRVERWNILAADVAMIPIETTN